MIPRPADLHAEGSAKTAHQMLFIHRLTKVTNEPISQGA
jgi:hypothetical protein